MQFCFWQFSRRILSVALTSIVLMTCVGVQLMVPVSTVVAETLVQNHSLDSSHASFTNHTTAILSHTDNTADGKYLMQVGTGAMKVEDDSTGGGGGCVGPASPYYWTLATAGWYEIRFLARNGKRANGTTDETLYFRVGSSMWGDQIVSTTAIDAPNWEYYSFKFQTSSANTNIYPQWYTAHDEDGAYFFIDEVQIAYQPELLDDNTFESDPAGWEWDAKSGASISRSSTSPHNGTYCMYVSGNGYVVYDDTGLSVTNDSFYTLELWVRETGAYDDITVFIGTSLTASGMMYHEVGDTGGSWTKVEYNFRADASTIYIHISGTSFYVDDVYLWNTRDEVLAQINYRAYAMHQIVNDIGATNLEDRYDEDMSGASFDKAHVHRAIISMFMGEVWSNYHDSTGLSNARTLLQGWLDENGDATLNDQKWGNDWQAGFMLETVMLPIHWIWGELDNVNAPTRSNIFNILTGEFDDYEDSIYTMKTSPSTDVSHVPHESARARDLWAWDTDYTDLSAVDTRAEDAAAWLAAIGYASELFTASSGNGYWGNRASAHNDAADGWQVVLGDNADLTTWDNFGLTNLRGVVTNTHKIANHNFYPNPWYTTAVFKTYNTQTWAWAILDETIPDYNNITCPDSSNCRMESPVYEDNWNSILMPDTGLVTSETSCQDGEQCHNWDNLANKEVGLQYKVMFLMEWYYLYNDREGYYEAQRIVRLLQDNHEWWPPQLEDVSNSYFKNTYTDQQKYDWFELLRRGGEIFSQYACRWEAMRAWKNGDLPSGNQFVADPLTW